MKAMRQMSHFGNYDHILNIMIICIRIFCSPSLNLHVQKPHKHDDQTFFNPQNCKLLILNTRSLSTQVIYLPIHYTYCLCLFRNKTCNFFQADIFLSIFPQKICLWVTAWLKTGSLKRKETKEETLKVLSIVLHFFSMH